MSRFPDEFIERFWAKVSKGRGQKCWEWNAYRARTGYGMLQARKISQQPMLAHRVSWELEHGEIKEGLHVLHCCDNPACVRPDHLFLGTQADNNADRHQKGRTASGDKNGARTMPQRNSFVRDGGSGFCGERHPMAKLTDRQVADLRAEFAAGVKRSDIADKYGVSVTHVYRLARGDNRA